MNCSSCGLVNREDARFCGECGAALAREVPCPSCREAAAKNFRPLIHERRSYLAHALGDEATHQRELREAHRLFTEIGATGHAERVARELT